MIYHNNTKRLCLHAMHSIDQVKSIYTCIIDILLINLSERATEIDQILESLSLKLFSVYTCIYITWSNNYILCVHVYIYICIFDLRI